ncbi:MAG TPA: PorV/PorQ family protein [bacterium]|jgi:outer membrane protein OmpA-like peptidoglycan-associated protein
MSRIRLASIITVCLLLVATRASAQNFGAPWLRMGVGARGMAMGTAQTAVAMDATAAYWNPALLVSLREYEASLMYTAGMKAERQYNYLSGTWNAQKIGAFSLSWMNAGITDIMGRDINRVPTGNFDVSQNAFQLSYGHWFGKGVGAGISGKYVQENLADNNGYGVDAGLIVKPYDELQFGAMVRDVTGKIGKDQTPYEGRLGIGVFPWQNVTIDLDLIKVKDMDATAAIGAAYHVQATEQADFYVAAGLNDLARDTRGFTAGFGVGYRYFNVQYAFVTEPQKWLQENHRLSVNFFFGKPNPLPSMLGSLRRHRDAYGEFPREITHRYIFEGNPTIRVQLELLRPAQRDSISQSWKSTGGVVTFPGINFAIGSAQITPEFSRVLQGVAQLIYEHPEIQLLEIQGHTDITGSDAVNIPLSKKRANAVRQFLIAQGIDGGKLVARGYGSKYPIASNSTENGRYQNRRIDIVRLK